MVQNQIELVKSFCLSNDIVNLTDDTLVYVAYRLWKKFFWYVHIKKWIPFAMCDECMELFARLMASKDPQEREEIKFGRQKHRDRCAAFRRFHELRIQFGLTMKDEFLSLIVDGMDNQKTQLPRLEGKLHSKTLNNVGEFLATKLLGVLAHGYGFYGGWCLPRYEGGSNLVCTVLLRVIQIIKAQRQGTLPPVLLIQADNCGRENKNQYMIAFLGWLLLKGYFKEIRMFFLTVGHTHCILDQRWSQIHKKITNRVVLDMEEMIETVSSLFKDDGFVIHELIEDIADFKEFFKGSKYDFQGLGTLRTTENKGRSIHALKFSLLDGQPVFWFKEFDSCGVPWSGDWKNAEKPISVFKATNFPADVQPAPRLPVKNMEKVKEKVAAVGAFCKVNLEDPASSNLSKLLHPTAVRAHHWWHQHIFQPEQDLCDAMTMVSTGQPLPASSKFVVAYPDPPAPPQNSKRKRNEKPNVAANGARNQPSPTDNTKLLRAVYEEGFKFVTTDGMNMESQHQAGLVYAQKARPMLDLLDCCTPSAVNQAFYDLKAIDPDLALAFLNAAEADSIISSDLGREVMSAPLYVCHTTDRVMNREVFNPSIHVRKEDVVLLTSDGQHASRGGWELARVTKIHPKTNSGEALIDIVYVLPESVVSSIEINENSRKWGQCAAWGEYDVWSKQRLLDWRLGKRRVWTDTVSLDSVWWAFTPTAKKVRTKNKDNIVLKSQIERVETAWAKLLRSDRQAGVTPMPPSVRIDPDQDPLTQFGSQVDDDEDDYSPWD
jgi:hypothetical protein